MAGIGLQEAHIEELYVQLALMSVESLTLQTAHKHNLKSLRSSSLEVEICKTLRRYNFPLESYYNNRMKRDLEWNKKHTGNSPSRQNLTILLLPIGQIRGMI